ncbi:MAG TPA: hypothetical protein VIE40_07295 [Dehalococcoidia bacterium]
MNESTFLQQLEQRTEQVKITLANLEAERTRIEGAIAQLQPLVPHYDALVGAERALVESQVKLDAPSSQQGVHEEHHEDGSEQTSEGSEPHQWGEQAQPEQHAGEEQPGGESQSWEEQHRATW